MQAASKEQWAAARFEITVMSRLRHPNLLPLLASHMGPAPYGSGGSGGHVAYMLFPLYSGGSLADLAERLAKDGRSLPASDVIHIFIQVGLKVDASCGFATGSGALFQCHQAEAPGQALA